MGPQKPIYLAHFGVGAVSCPLETLQREAGTLLGGASAFSCPLLNKARVLSTGGGGEASPLNVSASPPPQKKSFTEKNLQLFQIKIFFDDDFKESVKVTNVQKCDFSQS